jgi:hypothetical protein
MSSLFVPLQFPLSPMRLFAIGIKHPFDVPVGRLKQAHSREQHRSAILGGIDQHLNGKPPFLTVVV